MPALQTQVSFVNAWECDENDHLNVQFYFGRFTEADQHVRAMLALDPAFRRSARLVRYHAELREDDLVEIESGFALGDDGDVALVHALKRMTDGKVCATACDSFGDHARELYAFARRSDAITDVDARLYRPRGVTGGPAPAASRTELVAAGAFVTARAVVRPENCDHEGLALDRTHIGHFSDGASIFWEKIGLTKAFINRQGWGRVAVEMRLALHDAFVAGDLVEQFTVLLARSERTITFRHYQFEARSGRLVAIGDCVGMAMDLATRKAVRFPEGQISVAPQLSETAE
ncbi:thioesterase family protein [Amorphus coralli]|uniref:thioesterase family protein n=1 Tax=Amorphus coralli TaxID=340680 RepID=UPI000382E7D6|nr:thioesterase family protein [Amorphus coralli]